MAKRDPYAQWRDKDGFIHLQLAEGAKLPIGVKGKKNKYVYEEAAENNEVEEKKEIKTTEVDIGDYVYTKGIIHAKNMNVGRNIPWIEDGLKSVERRVLYTMYVEGWTNTAKRTKVDTVVGAMIKLCYPHGTQASDTVYRLGRSISTMIPYIDGKGNYGDIVTMRPAAARYAEARLSRYAMDCFFSETDVKVPIYDVQDNYKYDDVEPVYLPTKYPNILMQWNMGIGKGAYASIAAFNPTDVFNATLMLLDNPKAKIDIYPDCPVPVDIVNKSELKGCFDKYSFQVKIRGRYYVDTQIGVDENHRKYEKNVLVFTSCPMNTHGRAIEEAIIAIKNPDEKSAVKKRKDSFPEIIDIHPETAINPKTGERDQDLLELVIEYERGYDPHVLAEKLFKSTPLASTIPVKYNMIYENQPHKYTPRTVLLEWIKIRFDQKRRYFQQKVRKAAQDKVACEALLIIYRKGKIDEMIKIIKDTKSDEDTIKTLSAKYNITEFQSSVLANKSLRSLNIDNINKLKARYEQACIDYDHYRKMCEEKNIKQSIREDLEEGLKRYGRPRMAKLVNLKSNMEDPKDEKIIVYNHEGYYCLESYDELPSIANKIDKSYDIIKIQNKDPIMMFGTDGIMKQLDGYAFSLSTSGISFARLGFENVVRIIKADNPSISVAFITKDGYGKTMAFSECMKNVKGKVINLNTGDELASVIPIIGDGILGMVDSDKLYYVYTKQIPNLKRTSAGNRLIKNVDNVSITNCVFIPSTAPYVMIYGESGYVKVLDSRILVPATGRKSVSCVSMAKKAIYHVIALDDASADLVLYDVHGKQKIHIDIDKKITFSDEKKQIAKFAMSTTIATPTKVFKKGKFEFYRLRV